MRKKKIISLIIDILLYGTVLTVAGIVCRNVFHSESLWLELGIYLVFYAIAFGAKSGIVLLWKRFVSKKKEGNENDT